MEELKHTLGFYKYIEKYKEQLKQGFGKLVLTPVLLNQINKTLCTFDINKSLEHTIVSYHESFLLCDLDNTLKSVSKVKVYQKNTSSLNIEVDLERLKNVQELELIKICLEKIVGIGCFSSSLIELVCYQCCNILNFLRVNNWTNLSKLTITCCNISVIDDNIFENIKYIKYLDLQFNNLRSTVGFNKLVHIEYVNLSYNFLETVPKFSDSATTVVEVLLISHNNITDLKEICCLCKIKRLDLSFNCIFDRGTLKNLHNLKHLKWLRIDNNPLSSHPSSKMYFIPSMGTHEPPNEFLLDSRILRDAEMDYIETLAGEKFSLAASMQTSNPSLGQWRLMHSVPYSVNQEEEVTVENKKVLKLSSKKSRKGREVVIMESYGTIPEKIPAISAKNLASANEIIDDSERAESVMDDSLILSEDFAKSNSIHVIDLNTSDSTSDQNNSMKAEAVEKGREPCLGNERTEVNLLSIEEIHSSTCVKNNYHIVEATVHACEEKEGKSSFTPLADSSHLSIEEKQETEFSFTSEQEAYKEAGDEVEKERKPDVATKLEDCKEKLNSSADPSAAPFSLNEGHSTQATEDSVLKSELEFLSVDSRVTSEEISSDDSESDYFSGDENLWPVQKVVDSKTTPIFLVLLESELRERSTISGRTVTSYPLAFVDKCYKVSDDPLTITIEFASLLKQRTTRTYIMEFPDYQILMKKMCEILEARPLDETRLPNYKCKSCNEMFTVLSKTERVVCSSCGSTLVEESCDYNEGTEEEERPADGVVYEGDISTSGDSREEACSELPSSEVLVPQENFREEGESVDVLDPSVSSVCSSQATSQSDIGINSSSHSSIVASLKGIDPAHNSTNPCSAGSMNESEKLIRLTEGTKYESDIEVLSNPSQSSIEVIEDPIRKRWSEERKFFEQNNEILEEEEEDVCKMEEASESDCTTVESLVGEPCDLGATLTTNKLTETSSSVSASGSNITSMENSVMNRTLQCDPNENNIVTNISPDTTECSTGEGSIKKDENDIYSYYNFTDVDHRIKAYLYQYIFEGLAEELCLLVRCHLWKTGGTDYPALFVLSGTKLYIFIHKPRIYGLDASDWLQLQESHDIQCIKQICPLVWHQGVSLQINNLYYFILLHNKEYTENLFAAFKALPLKNCNTHSKGNTKIELSIQQVILSCNLVEEVLDPTVILLSICKKIVILKDDEVRETMKLASFLITIGEFYILLGDLGWMASTSPPPSIHFYQFISSLIEVGKCGNVLSLHYLDEREAVEEVWCLECSNEGQVDTIISAIKKPWQDVFSLPLEITLKTVSPLDSI